MFSNSLTQETAKKFQPTHLEKQNELEIAYEKLKEIGKKQIQFEEDNELEYKLLSSGLSFYYASEDCVRQRMFAYIPLPIISVTIAINYGFAGKFLCEYILEKFNITYEKGLSLKELYFKLPTEIQKSISDQLFFETNSLNDLIDLSKIADYTTDTKKAFEHTKFLIPLIRKLKNFAWDISQNNFFVDV